MNEFEEKLTGTARTLLLTLLGIVLLYVGLISYYLIY
jgi:hypothetical protein